MFRSELVKHRKNKHPLDQILETAVTTTISLEKLDRSLSSSTMPQRKKKACQSTKPTKHLEVTDLEALEQCLPDPSWVPLQPLQQDAWRPFAQTRGSRAYVDEMVQDFSWASQCPKDQRTWIASTLAVQIHPWILDYVNFREHVQDYCSRSSPLILTGVNALRVTYEAQQSEITKLRNAIEMLQSRVEHQDKTISEIQKRLHMTGTSGNMPLAQHPINDSMTLLPPPDDMLQRVQSAQSRAASQRSQGRAWTPDVAFGDFTDEPLGPQRSLPEVHQLLGEAGLQLPAVLRSTQ